MGKGSTAIQSDIERQRRALSSRINRLEQRVREDVETVKSEASTRTAEAKGQVTGKARSAGDKLSEAKGRLEETKAGSAAAKVSETAHEHPVGAVGAALGAGLALGLVTGGGQERSNGRHEPSRGREEPRGREESQEPGRVRRLATAGTASLATKGASSLAETIKSEFSALAKDFLDGAFHAGKKGEAAESTPAPLQSAWGRMPHTVDKQLPPRTTHPEVSAEEMPPVL